MVVGVGKAVEEAPHLSGAPADPVGGDDLFTPIAGQLHSLISISVPPAADGALARGTNVAHPFRLAPHRYQVAGVAEFHDVHGNPLDGARGAPLNVQRADRA